MSLDEPFDCILTNAAGDDTEGVIRVMRAGSASFLKIIEEQRWRHATPLKGGGFMLNPPSPEEAEREAIEVLTACTLSWNIGQECTPENATKLYTDYWLIRQQVHEAVYGQSYGFEDELAFGISETPARATPQSRKRRYDGPNRELAQGDFEGAERFFRNQDMIEWRRRDGSTIPCWNGEPVKTLFFLLAAGFGDQLLSWRYVRGLSRLVERITVAAPAAMYPLVRKYAPHNVEVFEQKDCPEAVRDADAYVNMNRLFYQTGEGYGDAKWITGEGEREETATPRVGIVWSGNTRADYNALRAIPLARFAPLFDVPGIEWHSLQTGPKAAECPAHVINHVHELHSFLDTAALIATLDLVITVDTACANLAGSMGHPFWVMVERPGESDFRWALSSESTSWFPSARVFRQGNDRKWKRVMRRVAGALVNSLKPGYAEVSPKARGTILAHPDEEF